MTHWITPVHEINRSCVDVKWERKRLFPRRVPKTKFPTKLRGRGWNTLINSPKTRMCPNAHWHETRSSCARLPWLDSPCLGVFCTLSSLTTVKACRGVTTPLLPLLHRDVPEKHSRKSSRETLAPRDVSAAGIQPQQLSLPGHTPREIQGKVKENRKRRKAMKLQPFLANIQ